MGPIGPISNPGDVPAHIPWIAIVHSLREGCFIVVGLLVCIGYVEEDFCNPLNYVQPAQQASCGGEELLHRLSGYSPPFSSDSSICSVNLALMAELLALLAAAVSFFEGVRLKLTFSLTAPISE